MNVVRLWTFALFHVFSIMCMAEYCGIQWCVVWLIIQMVILYFQRLLCVHEKYTNLPSQRISSLPSGNIVYGRTAIIISWNIVCLYWCTYVVHSVYSCIVNYLVDVSCGCLPAWISIRHSLPLQTCLELVFPYFLYLSYNFLVHGSLFC